MPIPGFHGRAEELAWLRRLWDECTQRDPATGRFAGGPRAAFVIAESGIGKSRLVQALYQQLTTDPAWDPPEVNYWPDAFNDQGVQLRVVPGMEGHVAKGPPRFAWLGARWQPTDVRNVSDRRSALPELRHSIMVHAEILRRQGSAWQDATGRICEAIRRDGAGEFIGQVADAAVPFGGLLMKLFKGAADLAKDRLDGPRSVEQAEDAASKTLVDEVCECLHSLVDGAGGLPTVLWLDDAQWIDAETQEFVRRVWGVAERRKWPLLLVVTHWEREWRELSARGEAGPLQSMRGQAGVEVRVLSPAPPASLSEYVQSRLPGLTAPQRELLLDKSAGNFLTMVENVGQLLRVPMNFVGRDTAQALTPAGERVVQQWESDRQKRVEQRFTELAPELQEMLGWGSHLGMSFLREVVEEFAERVAGQRGAAERMREAVDPLVILGEPSEHLREFRDKAFHHVARRHFENYGSEHAAELDRVLRERLVEWVNNSFDAEGNGIWPDAAKGIVAPPRAVTGMSNEEARDVLGMALMHLPLGDPSGWSDPAKVAALRARYLLVAVDRRHLLWDRVRASCMEVGSVDWESVPARVLSASAAEWMADQAETSGALAASRAILVGALALVRERAKSGAPDRMRALSYILDKVAGVERAQSDLDTAFVRHSESLSIARGLAHSLGTAESLCDLRVLLSRVAFTEGALGRLEEASSKLVEALGIARRLSQSLGTPDSRRHLSISLNNVGGIEHYRENVDAAYAMYSESLSIARDLAELLGTPESARDVHVIMGRIARIEKDRGDLDSAHAKYEDSLKVFRGLADSQKTPGSLFDLSICLDDVGGVELLLGDVDQALARYLESLEIRRGLVGVLGTPGIRGAMARSLGLVAGIESSLGDSSSALAKYTESLAIRRQLAKSVGSPESHRELSIGLEQVAGIEQANGDLVAALERLTESLEIRRRLADLLNMPENLRDMSNTLETVARIAHALGDRDGAHAKYTEALMVRRGLAGSLGTHQNLRSLCNSLRSVAVIDEARGDLGAALARYEEAIEVARRVADAETMVLADVQRYLRMVFAAARIEIVRGDAAASIRRLDSELAGFEAAEFGDPPSERLLRIAAQYWEIRARALAALDRSDDASDSRARAVALRARIAGMGDG